MDSAKWQRAQQLFNAALEMHGSERSAYLARACAGDRELLDQVESLLEADESAGDLESRFVEGAAELAEDLEREQRNVGEYRLLEEISSDRVATVYRAERRGSSEPVAVKLVERGSDPAQILRRLQDRRQVLTSLQHDGVARLLDGGQAPGGKPYFAVELVDGPRLHRHCEEHALGIGQRLTAFVEVCDAISHLHQQGVVHGALELSTLRLSQDGRVKVLDAGLAEVIGETASGRLSAHAYASPERVRGGPASVASDVFALGVILYELLSGSRPYRFASSSPAEIERVICEQVVERPSVAASRPLRRRLSGDLDAICLQALHKDPEQRYGSVEGLREDLDRHRRGLPVRARPSTAAYRAGKFFRRHVLMLSAAVVVIVLISLFFNR